MLRAHRVKAVLFGGWAEEALGLSPVREHRDIDIVVEIQNFQSIDKLFASRILPGDIAAKRFHHKRAFIFRETLVELLGVEIREDCRATVFWGDIEYLWLDPLAEAATLGGHFLDVVTAANLRKFRASHATHQNWRWKDPFSLVDRS